MQPAENRRLRLGYNGCMSFSYTILLLPLLLLFAGVPFLLTLRNSAVTESAWFWGYLFGMFALVALSIAGPKFAARQAQLEQQFQGRERALQIRSGEEPSMELSTPENTIITLWPLYAGLSAATVIAWVVFWWTRRKTLETRGSGGVSRPTNLESRTTLPRNSS